MKAFDAYCHAIRQQNKHPTPNNTAESTTIRKIALYSSETDGLIGVRFVHRLSSSAARKDEHKIYGQQINE